MRFCFLFGRMLYVIKWGQSNSGLYNINCHQIRRDDEVRVNGLGTKNSHGGHKRGGGWGGVPTTNEMQHTRKKGVFGHYYP